MPIWVAYTIARFLAQNEFFARMNALPNLFIDFRKYYSMARMLFSDMREHIYDPSAQLQFFNLYGSLSPAQRLLYSEYPPFFFPLVAPFALIPINQAFIAWCLLSMTIGLSVVWRLSRTSGLTTTQSWLLTFGVVASIPTWLCVMLGQSSFFLLGIIGFFCWSLLKNRDTACGIALALSTIKPQYAPFLCIPLIAQRRWRALLAAIVCESALLIFAALIIGWKNVLHYPHILLSADTNFAQYLLVCLRGPLSSLMPYSEAFNLSIILLIIACCLLYSLWRGSSVISKGNVPVSAAATPEPERAQAPTLSGVNAESTRWLLAVTICSAIALSPHTHAYDCVLLAIPAALTIQTLSPTRAMKISSTSLRLWNLAFLLYPLFAWLMWVLFTPAPLLRFYSLVLFNAFVLILAFFRAYSERQANPKGSQQT